MLLNISVLNHVSVKIRNIIDFEIKNKSASALKDRQEGLIRDTLEPISVTFLPTKQQLEFAVNPKTKIRQFVASLSVHLAYTVYDPVDLICFIFWQSEIFNQSSRSLRESVFILLIAFSSWTQGPLNGNV